MSNLTALRGSCPAPFFDPSKFSNGGFVNGRFCASIIQDLTCCLPCPATDWLYPESFNRDVRIAEGLNIASLSCCVFLLISFLVLPTDQTRSNYLSYCLIVAITLLNIGFVVPFGKRPPQCYDEITPNDMYSNLTCAFSGAFVIAGSFAADVWIFIRALAMHLQICWDVMPGRRFFYASQALGWGVTAALFTVTITLTGVSFRFGDACHVNSLHSKQDFWGPLLAIAGLSAIVQLSTFVYCFNVYLRNVWSDDRTETQSSSGLPSYTASTTRTRSAKAVYRRVRRVFYLQWRGILIVVCILVDVIFFAIVFLTMDSEAQRLKDDVTEALPWLFCLIENPNDKSKCFSLAQKNFVNEVVVTAVLILLSFSGVEVTFLLTRPAVFTSWWNTIRSRFSKKREFVSLDARRFSSDARTFELLKVGQNAAALKSPETAYTSPVSFGPSDSYAYGRSETPEFLKESQRDYQSPKLSFSSPRAPSRAAYQMDWDPRSTHARGGLGLHPPLREDDDDFGMSNKI